MDKGIGIQWEQGQFTIAVVERERDKLLLSTMLYAKTQSETEALEKIALLLLTQELSSYPIVLSMPARQAIFRKFSVPFTKQSQISQIIAYEMESHIQSLPIEELMVDYHILKVDTQSTQLLTAAIPKENLEKTINLVESYCIYPFMVDIDIMGLLFMVQSTDMLKNSPNLLLMDVHHHVCNLITISQGQLLDIRAIPIKSDETETIENPNVVDPSKPVANKALMRKTLFLREGFRQTEILKLGLKSKVYLRILKELRRTVLGSQSIDAIYLCGDKELLEALPVFLEKRLKIPVAPLNIASSMELIEELKKEDISYASIAIGLALKALDRVEGGFNFRQGSFAYRKTFDIVKNTLAFTLTLLFLAFLLPSLHLHKKISTQHKAYDKLVSITQKIYLRHNPEGTLDNAPYFDRIYTVQEFFTSQKEDHQDKLIELTDATRIWPMLFRSIAMVRKKYYFTLEHFSIGQSEVLLEGLTQSDLFLDDLKQALRKLPIIDPQEDAMRLSSSPLTTSTDHTLTRQYKISIQLRKREH
jgi:Tfp pilus assembly PilM family ATPase